MDKSRRRRTLRFLIRRSRVPSRYASTARKPSHPTVTAMRKQIQVAYPSQEGRKSMPRSPG